MFRFARRHMTPQTIVRKPWRALSDAEKSVDFEFDIHWLRYRRRYIGNREKYLSNSAFWPRPARTIVS